MPPSPAIVRPAAASELARLVELLILGSSRALKEDPKDLLPYQLALVEIGASRHNTVLVAEYDGDVVGVCQLFAVRHLQERGGLCAEIESMHVHPDSRGRGIGTQLLNAAVEVASGWGCYRVQLTSNKVRSDAHRFYQRAGFVASHEGFKLQLR
jgi:GNAT superfamily N-acetyltransferase